jgi:hydrogenase maturation protease
VRVVVAGVGNVLRRDDGFGVHVVDHLQRRAAPEEVQILDIGIGGIHLVHELLEHADALIVVDALDLGRPPGTVLVVRPEVRVPEGRDDLADMHYATPERALMLASALGVLPDCAWIVGCQPEDADGLGQELTPTVARAVEPAAAEVRRLAATLGVSWPAS